MIAAAIVGVAAIVSTSTALKKHAAKKKYNSSTVSVYKRGTTGVTKKKVNAEVYHPKPGATNIHIAESLQINTKAEQNAVLDVIMDSPLYDKKTFGSKRFMRAQWFAHNQSHKIASSGALGYKLMSLLSNSSTPIESSEVLDLRSKNNISPRQKVIYTMISWVY